MPFPQPILDSYATYSQLTAKLAKLRQAQTAGLLNHVTVTVEPVDPTSQLDVKIAEVANAYGDGLVDLLAHAMARGLKKQIDDEREALRVALHTELEIED